MTTRLKIEEKVPPMRKAAQGELRTARTSFLFSPTFIAKLAAAWFSWALSITIGRPIRTVSTPMPRVVPLPFSIGHNIPLSREICKLCFRDNPVGFYVPDEIWKDVIPSKYCSRVVCISCFTCLADEKLIPWDREIQLYPVSMNTHLNNVKFKIKNNYFKLGHYLKL